MLSPKYLGLSLVLLQLAALCSAATQIQQIDDPDNDPTALFSANMALSKDVLAVASIGFQGKVTIYQLQNVTNAVGNASDPYVKLNFDGVLPDVTPDVVIQLGYNIAFNGNKILVSSNPSVGSFAGVYAFQRFAAGNYTLLKRFTSVVNSNCTLFGAGAAIGDNFIAITASCKVGPASSKVGLVYFHKYDSVANTWNFHSTVFLNSVAPSSPYRLAMGSDYLVITPTRSLILVYRYNQTLDSWVQQFRYNSTGEGLGDLYASVRVYDDAFIVSATVLVPPVGASRGAGIIFRFDPNAQTWNKEAVLYPNDASASNAGEFVALENNVALVTATLGSGNSVVYIYNRINGVWVYQTTVFPTLPASAAYFGWSAVVSSTYGALIAGAYDGADSGVVPGDLFIFSECLIGTHSSKNGTNPYQCDPCDPGSFASKPRAAFCTLCPAGQHMTLSGSTYCEDCLVGTYASQPGTPNCSLCAPGTFTNANGTVNCQSCASGFYMPTSGATACLSCPAGSYATNNAVDCLQCPAGFISADNSVSCTGCPAGNHASSNGSTVCLQCTPGSFASSTGTPDCSLCVPGTFTGANGTVNCQPCASGFYMPTSGATACLSCPAGSYAVNAIDCVPCPAGFYSNVNSVACTPCALGTFAESSGSAQCQNCPAGMIAPNLNSTACTNCTTGKYAATQGLSICTLCEAGKFGPFEGLSQCPTCDAGKYSSSGWIGCLACGVGKYAGAAASVCISCATGTFANTTGKSVCDTCRAGSYSGLAASTCAICGFGNYSATDGQSTCTQCATGSYSLAGPVTACTLCQLGYYAPLAATVCTICGYGQFGNRTGLGACLTCESGTANPKRGSTQASDCAPCPSGFTSSPGAYNCTIPIPSTDSSNSLPIIPIAAGAGGGGALLIVIIVVFCCCKRRPGKGSTQGRSASGSIGGASSPAPASGFTGVQLHSTENLAGPPPKIDFPHGSFD